MKIRKLKFVCCLNKAEKKNIRIINYYLPFKFKIFVKQVLFKYEYNKRNTIYY